MKKIITAILTLLGISTTSAQAQNNAAADLRNMLLSFPNTPQAQPYKNEPLIGILMDTTFESGQGYTLAVIIDGTTSLYYSTGGGLIGIGEHENVKSASKTYFELAKNYLAKAKETKTFPLPNKGNAIFYFITPSKILATNEIKESELGKGKQELSPLFYKAQDVITQARLVAEKL